MPPMMAALWLNHKRGGQIRVDKLGKNPADALWHGKSHAPGCLKHQQHLEIQRVQIRPMREKMPLAFHGPVR